MKIAMLFLSALFMSNHVKAQQELDVLKSWIHFTDAGNSLYQHVTKQAFNLLDKRSGQTNKLVSLKAWQERQKLLNKTLLNIVGPFPSKTALNARVVKTIAKDGYKVENIIYESQPGFYVTSSLFIPAGLKGKAPAIIYCSGHSNDGYRTSVYQQVILNLVKKGFVVFAFDPIGQGERLEYQDPASNKSLSPMTEEHSYSGVQAFITGGYQARHVIWDGIRAVDYLLTRNEIDASRIGLTGRSGGGTQTAFIGALDDRIYAVAPENYITNFKRLLQNIGPQDAEQNLFQAISRGIDMEDLLIVRAPKPALLITTTRDIFNIQGASETAKQVSRAYQFYGKRSNFNMVTDDAPHASTKKNRESMYAFFQKHLNNPGDSSDKEMAILTPQELQVTRTGQVSTSLNSETVFSLNHRLALSLEERLNKERGNIPEHLKKILTSAKKISGYQQPQKVDNPVFVGRFQREGYAIEKYFVKGEGDYAIPYLLMKPEQSNGNAIIYLHPSGKSYEAGPGKEIEQFIKNGFTVLAPDLLAIGEMKFVNETFKRSYLIDWYASMLIGRSVTGIQSADVIRLVNVLKQTGDIKEVFGFARKEMAPVLLHAAAFDARISRVALVEPYSSYYSVATNRFYYPGFIHSLVPAAMQAYDLPDLAATLAPRKLLMFAPTDGAGVAIESVDTNPDFSFIKTAYKYRKADNLLNIISSKSSRQFADVLEEWMR